jgi:hypothetical protein
MTRSPRAQISDTRVFDPTGSTGLVTAAWSPVAAASTWECARRTAARLLEVGQGEGGSSIRVWCLEQMHEEGVAGAQTALQALQQVWEADARTRSSLLITATTTLDGWQEPAVAAVTGGPPRSTLAGCCRPTTRCISARRPTNKSACGACSPRLSPRSSPRPSRAPGVATEIERWISRG